MGFLRFSLIAGLILFSSTASAVGYVRGILPKYQTEITPLPDGTYRVRGIGSSAPVTYWCGIGDYAIRTLGLPSNQRIYVSKPYERGARTVEFSFTPPPGADTGTSYSVGVKRVGENRSASSAQNFCYDNIIEFGT